MTVENVATIDMEDVLAVRYKCSKCGAVLSIPIDIPHSVPDSCSTCKRQWFSSMSMTAQQQVFEMLHHLREVQKWVSSEDELPLKIEFEISNI